MNQIDPSMSLTQPNVQVSMNTRQKIGAALSGLGLLILVLSLFNVGFNQNKILFLSLALGGITIGTLFYAWGCYGGNPAGIKNNGVWFRSMTNLGVLAWASGVIITGFYILLYWYPKYLGLGADGMENSGMIALFDPLSRALSGNPASQWFMYGALYTLAILVMGIKFMWKYRHNKYQVLRTISVMFFQTGFAFLLPEILARLNGDLPYNDFKNMWPLNYYFFDGYRIEGYTSTGGFGLFMLIFGIAMVFIISPILTYFYGKRWYCSWVCGCGGLAETLGDPYRHLSDKSLKAWEVERWMIHGVLVFVVMMTVAVIYGYLYNHPEGYWLTKEVFLGIVILTFGGLALLVWLRPAYLKGLEKRIKNIIYIILGALVLFTTLAYVTGNSNVFFIDNYQLRSWYGFLIGAAFSGVVGVGFYPLMGSRVWCRFGCPMAAILGIQQRFFSRFRITTNGSQCISCGNCSTYCEMGIDVRAYAQKGQDIVRASCVGCGICAAVCPRGVLRLENSTADIKTRTDLQRVIKITGNSVSLMD
jgi:Pyruvate/2-oxoacid:ferredoxin oxidoreductase delta subunit